MPNIQESNCNTYKTPTEALNEPNIVPNVTLSFVGGCGMPKGSLKAKLVTSSNITPVSTATPTGDNAAIITSLRNAVIQLQQALKS